MTENLKKAKKDIKIKKLKAIIGPYTIYSHTSIINLNISKRHAGYFYSGQVAAWGYQYAESKPQRVFLLGPNHHAS